ARRPGLRLLRRPRRPRRRTAGPPRRPGGDRLPPPRHPARPGATRRPGPARAALHRQTRPGAVLSAPPAAKKSESAACFRGNTSGSTGGGGQRMGTGGSLIRDLRAAVLRREPSGLSDGELLECFVLERDEAAFEALLRRHGPMVLGTCRRLLN